MRQETRRLTDAGALRALAHPVRQEIYEHIVLRGALTATELGDLLDETPANCSWHLRKLAEHGFVEPAEGGKGRQRPWQATSRGLSWGGAEDDDETRRTGTAMTRMMVDRERTRLDHALERLRTDDPVWDEAANVNQSLLWLTADELAEINETLKEIATRSLDRHDDPSLRPPGSRLCAFLAWAVPTYDVIEPTPDDDTPHAD